MKMSPVNLEYNPVNKNNLGHTVKKVVFIVCMDIKGSFMQSDQRICSLLTKSLVICSQLTNSLVICSLLTKSLVICSLLTKLLVICSLLTKSLAI